MDLEEIREEIRKGRKMEEVLGEVNWSQFEDFCGEIFQKHGFEVETNVRFKAENWYEIDLVAERKNLVIAADCKHWGRRKGKKYGLKRAVERQKKRVEMLPEAENLDWKLEGKKLYPLLVTWLPEEIVLEEGVWIVPVFKLNRFILELGRYLSV